MSSDQSKKPAFPDTKPTTASSETAQVPDTAPTTPSNSAPFPDTKPATKSDAPKVTASSPKAHTPAKTSAQAIKPDQVYPPLQRNARPYTGQKLALLIDGKKVPIQHNVDLAVVGGRVLDHAPWTGWPIVELS